MKNLTAADTNSAFVSRLSPVLSPACSAYSSMLGQSRLETIHLSREDAEDCFTTNPCNFGKTAVHLSGLSIIRQVAFKLGSCNMFAKTSVRATQASALSNSALPARSYLLWTRGERRLLADEHVQEPTWHSRDAINA